MPEESTLYELLQVDRRASQDVIEAAYHRLAKKYHPDVNKSANALEMMQRLNYAYETLSDPQKRTAYDKWLSGETQQPSTPKEEPKTQRTARPQPIPCQNCGKIDETIRVTVFQYVISILILSFKRGGGAGILCSECRTRRAIGYTLLSILFGPWGLPWGILWTIEAIIVNLSGGKQPADVNGPLLRSMGIYFWMTGDSVRATRVLKESLRFEENAAVREFLKDHSPRQHEVQGTLWGMSPSQSAIILILAVLVVLVFGVIGSQIWGVIQGLNISNLTVPSPTMWQPSPFPTHIPTSTPWPSLGDPRRYVKSVTLARGVYGTEKFPTYPASNFLMFEPIYAVVQIQDVPQFAKLTAVWSPACTSPPCIPRWQDDEKSEAIVEGTRNVVFSVMPKPLSSLGSWTYGDYEVAIFLNDSLAAVKPFTIVKFK